MRDVGEDSRPDDAFAFWGSALEYGETGRGLSGHQSRNRQGQPLHTDSSTHRKIFNLSFLSARYTAGT